MSKAEIQRNDEELLSFEVSDQALEDVGGAEPG